MAEGLFTHPAFLAPLFTGLASIGLSLVVFFADMRSTTRRWFFMGGLSIGVWTILTAFSIILAHKNPIMMNITVFVSWLVAPSLLFAFINFPKKEDMIPARVKIIAGVVVVATMMFHLFAPHLFVREISGVADTFFLDVGPLYILSPLELFVGIGTGFFFLYKTFRKSEGRLHVQMAASMIGIVIAVVGTFLGNTFSPWLGYMAKRLCGSDRFLHLSAL